MIQEAGKAGIDFNDIVKKGGKNVKVSTIPSAYKTVTNPIVHDSLTVELSAVNFIPGREFRWVGRDVKKGQEPLQSTNCDHLKSNWRDSLKFQPTVNGEENDIFQQIRD